MSSSAGRRRGKVFDNEFIKFMKSQGIKFVDVTGELIKPVKKHNTLKGGKNYESKN